MNRADTRVRGVTAILPRRRPQIIGCTVPIRRRVSPIAPDPGGSRSSLRRGDSLIEAGVSLWTRPAGTVRIPQPAILSHPGAVADLITEVVRQTG